ncbi:MAG: transcription termination/antitermination protein NusA [Lachnospiraceae bacterium]|nr:transcription termination/antitermination protein NusA [Lachnospiraceae bacterium]MBO4787876.1 transcription termination/antitermination protein NusA [Lachnospiraceae bacterium]MBQ2032373.1 transcription termination/antitermination protein NusA [Lachnospiraceae bacterium]MBQ3979397.1 transcription termination/antitermination protein NusA [Lachnospiraceae bacterium]MCR5376364.1 transcription termination factor NusA [Lachnospiraceae bacterium]
MKKEDFKELIEALNLIEKERDISKEVLLKAIEDSLLAACKDEYGKSENIRVHIDPETGEYNVFRDMKVVDEVVDPETEMTLLQAQTALPLRDIAVGDTVSLDVKTKNFGRIAAGKAKQVIVQKLREEERKVLFGQYCGKEKEVVTGIVQKFSKKNVIISLGKVDASLIETEQIPGEVFRTGDRVKVYVVEVKDMTKGPRIVVSRTHPELVKRFFENEVSEVADGTVEIKALSREAGKRTKMAVWSNDPKVDPVGACVGVNGSRVNAVVDELNGEKIDIISWSDNPAQLIANALSPAEVISVDVIEAERLANVIVPDDQLTLAIGSKGQNARLAARLTGYKIDIKSESQAEGLA